MTFAAFAETCAERIELDVERRPGNALNLEIGAPVPRCRLRPPEHWGDRAPSVSRWLRSGGSPLVLGHCECRGCPLLREARRA